MSVWAMWVLRLIHLTVGLKVIQTHQDKLCHCDYNSSNVTKMQHILEVTNKNHAPFSKLCISGPSILTVVLVWSANSLEVASPFA